MTHQDENMSSPIVSQLADTARTTARSSLSPLRHRALGRAATFSGKIEGSKLRRTSSLSSSFSDSIDDARTSIKSTTDDLLYPQAKTHNLSLSGHEGSHWHSLPLALALLPAAGGLFFEKGSVIITDLTLLALAAVFLNWSVRLPWDWYLSAQCIAVLSVEEPDLTSQDSDAIVEEEEGDEGHEESQTSRAGSPAPSQRTSASTFRQVERGQSAASELRLHELLALMTCFISPMIGAWLLHHIRAQLSRPSEGLVSNYNLTIFLLASELRPLSHLIKLVQARTLFLQRTVAANPHTNLDASNILPSGNASRSSIPQSTVQDLKTRLDELESHVVNTITPRPATSENGTPTSPLASSGMNAPRPGGALPPLSPLLQSQLPDLTASVRKSLSPDLDALNRAVRRYEKRATLLSMQTEKRLQDLEARMGDAITLAAAAERSSHQNSSSSSLLLNHRKLFQRSGSNSGGLSLSNVFGLSSSPSSHINADGSISNISNNNNDDTTTSSSSTTAGNFIGGLVSLLIDGLATLVLLPLQIIWSLLTLPIHIVGAVIAALEDKVVRRSGRKGNRTSGSSSSKRRTGTTSALGSSAAGEKKKSTSTTGTNGSAAANGGVNNNPSTVSLAASNGGINGRIAAARKAFA